jgi:hypothetical protein
MTVESSIAGSIAVSLVQECKMLREPCVPEVVEEPWFSVKFVAGMLGFEEETFTKKINKLGIPRHPIQKKCIRISSLARMHSTPDAGSGS